MNGSYFSLRCLCTWGHKGGTSHTLLVEEGAALHHDSWEIFWLSALMLGSWIPGQRDELDILASAVKDYTSFPSLC